MTDTPWTAEVAEYEAAVRRHLADVPAAAREDLLADLETHLTEVAADLEPGVSLADRLGSAETYARELRETVDPPSASAGDRFRKGVGNAANRYTGSAGVGEAAEFGRAAVPGWWVVRGFLFAGLVFIAFWKAGQRWRPSLVDGLMHLWPLTAILFAALVLGGVWLSLKIGAASANWGRGRRRLESAGGLAVVALTLWFVAWVGTIYWPQEPVGGHDTEDPASESATTTEAPDAADETDWPSESTSAEHSTNPEEGSPTTSEG